ncbi:unnamed protein product, partial [marine sediment metagenome]
EGIYSNIVSGNTTDTSNSVASAASLELPIEHDTVWITGTTDITSIDLDNETDGYSGFAGKELTLIFAGILDVKDGG